MPELHAFHGTGAKESPIVGRSEYPCPIFRLLTAVFVSGRVPFVAAGEATICSAYHVNVGNLRDTGHPPELRPLAALAELFPHAIRQVSESTGRANDGRVRRVYGSSFPRGEVPCSCGRPTLELFLIGGGRLSGFHPNRQPSARSRHLVRTVPPNYRPLTHR
jgi:hypothetical protein